MSRIEKIRATLEQNFKPHKLEIVDESHLHAGHWCQVGKRSL